MNLYSDTLTAEDVRDAATFARRQGHDIHLQELTERAGRKRRHSVTFYCESFGGRFATNRRGKGDTGRAASWTAWGWLLTYLFCRDPEAIVGYYKGARHFRQECQRALQHRKRYGDNTDFLDYLINATHTE